MEALDMLLSRRSVKRFAPDVLPAHSDLQRIADAGANAPTGRGRQSPFIVVVTDRAVRDQLSRLNAEILGRDGDPFYGAPVVMVVLADRAQPTYLYDGSLVMGNLLNAAHALGWGACWIHRAREIFERPEGKALLSQWGIDADVKASVAAWWDKPNTSPPIPKPAKRATSVSSDCPAGLSLFVQVSPHHTHPVPAHVIRKEVGSIFFSSTCLPRQNNRDNFYLKVHGNQYYY